MMKAFNDLADFSSEEIGALIELAGRLDAHPEPEALKGKVLSLLFLSPSLRTLASFQAAMVARHVNPRAGSSRRYRHGRGGRRAYS
jgi:ornithine carbamoyltransferase